jgi:hypothetical protein
MVLPINISHSLRTPDELRDLVKAIRDAPASEPETDNVEWKSEWNLEDSDKSFETARHVLGFGNRSIAAASKEFEGCAYFLAGVEPGNLCGTVPIDPAKISDKLSRYIENGAPRWSPQYVEVDGASVLVITVEVPKGGDPICVLQKAFDKFSKGRIFIRRHGKTEEAGPADLRELETRIRAGRPRVELSVRRIHERPLHVISVPPEASRDWLKSEGERLELPPPPSPRSRGIFEAPVLPFSVDTDPRSRETYGKEVSAYLRRAESRWLARLFKSAIEADVSALRLQIENSTDRNYDGVEVVLEIPAGPIVWHQPDEVDSTLAPPTPPKAWGKKRMIEFEPPALSGLGFQGPVEIERGEDLTTVRFQPEHVRPLAAVSLPVLHLVLRENPGAIDISWRLTSSTVDGQTSGALTCDVADSPIVPQFGEADGS